MIVVGIEVPMAGVRQLPLDARVILARQKRFYAKLVYRAICDIVNYKDSEEPKNVEICEHAKEWMYNGFDTEDCEDKGMYVKLKLADDSMSFETACSMLEWDPAWVRERVKFLTRRDLERIGRNGLI